MRVLVSPSVLSADFSRVAEDIRRCEEAGADMFHLDVMDGHFVPNITFGPRFVAAVRRETGLPLETHLMISEPENFAQAFIDAGSDMVTVHVECPGAGAAIETIRKAGKRPGITLNPETPFEALTPYLGDVDLLLVMTVRPGWGGQKFMPEQVPKIRRAREAFKGEYIAVDGGVNFQNAPACREAGANVLISGTTFFKAPDMNKAIRELRGDAGTN